MLKSILVAAILFWRSSCQDEFNLTEFYLRIPDGERLSKWEPSSGQNPEEMGNLIEGDMFFVDGIRNDRNLINDEESTWKSGIVVYEFAESVSETNRKKILQAMTQFHLHTCIRFRERRPKDGDYVQIRSEKSGCWSMIGKIRGPQTINLESPQCFYEIGTSIHELMHSIGVLHEHTRLDRDDYVDIFLENVSKGDEENFQKAKNGTVQTFGIPYDYESVMHYSSNAFSTNKKPTILPKNRGGGPRLSLIISQKVNEMRIFQLKPLPGNIMSLTNAIMVIFLAVALPLTVSRSFTSEELNTDLRFIKTCNMTSPISMRAMNEVLINKQLGHGESSAFKCFLHCLFMKYGWMDTDGGFLLHDIKQTLEESDVEIASLEFILYKCTATESIDRCERAFIFTQCFWEKMAEQQPSEDQFFYNIEDKK